MFLDLNERALKLVKIRLGNLQNCEEAADLVVAIDVIRVGGPAGAAVRFYRTMVARHRFSLLDFAWLPWQRAPQVQGVKGCNPCALVVSFFAEKETRKCALPE